MVINDKTDPLVSVIVAIYKSEPFVAKCIESICSQDYKELEIILVDDGSPDNSGLICDQYEKIDSRIIVIHKENGGTCDARNVGLAKASGDYILIVDGDDWLEHDYVSYLMGLVNKYKTDMAMTYYIFTTRDRKQIEHDEVQEITSEDAVTKLLYPIVPIGPWNKIYSRKMIEDNDLSFSVPWSGEGLYFSTMAAQYSGKVAVGKRKIYNYRLNNSGSGLTNYNVQIGINALYNIQNIKANLIVDTPRTRRAADWHIWKNYGYLLYLIVATSSEDENRELLINCKRGMRRMLPKALYRTEIGLIEKGKMIIKTLFPIRTAQYRLKKERAGLMNDTME